jgi:anhydro-N-acetylmuramic acid kinase
MRTIGLMSGTSLDGVDGVLCDWNEQGQPQVLAFSHAAFEPALRAELFALQAPGANELARSALAANGVAVAYASVVKSLLNQASLSTADIRVIGAHGQTVRHVPNRAPSTDASRAYSIQLLNAALLVETTGIAVVHDLRSRDLAAGGQGAPLLPIFHARLFAQHDRAQVVCNIGGIANITVLGADGGVFGFDTGPGNCLMDFWATQHLHQSYDKDGAFAARGNIHALLQAKMLEEPYFTAGRPKSTGRDLFNPQWLAHMLKGYESVPAADVQATLCELTAQTIANAIAASDAKAGAIWVCGGGAFNGTLMRRLAALTGLPCSGTSMRGAPEDQVEALAFAWFAREHVMGKALNLAAITGSSGPRIAGSYTPP